MKKLVLIILSLKICANGFSQNAYMGNSLNATLPCSITTNIVSQNNVSCFGGNNGSVTISASNGTGAFTYSWSPSGGTSATASNLSAGSYTCLVKDANLCASTRTILITQPAVLTAVISATNSNCGQNNGKVCANVAGGTAPLSFQWSNGVTTLCNNNVPAGVYNFMATDFNGCTVSASVIVNDFSGPVVSIITTSNVSCFGGNNGGINSIITGGVPAYSISWSTGQTTQNITNLTAGIKNITVVDAAGCVATASVNITQPTQIVSAIGSFTNTNCNQNNGGARILCAGGTAAYSYSWTPSAQTTSVMTNVGAGNYTCTITDANGCATSSSVTISQNTFSVSSSQNNVSCYGNTNGAASVSVTPAGIAYTYSWVPYGGNYASVNNLSAGNYSCIITNSITSCSVIQTLTITQPPPTITSVGSSTNVNCYGGNNGAAMAVAPTPTLTDVGSCCNSYSWSPTGGTYTTAINLSAGNYTCAVYNGTLGCTTLQTVTITQPTSITAIASQTNVSCNGSTNGSASVIASGGTGSYTYSWSPTGGNSNTATNLSSGTYTCLIKDANNCTRNQLFTITQSTTSNINNTTNLVAGTLSSNQYNATYQWINCGTGNSNVSGATTQTFAPVINGSYAVIINYNGCTATSSCTTISNVGIEEYQLANQVPVSPNPSTSQFNFSGLVGENTIQITDITGRALLTEKTNTENHTIKLNAAQGIYFYKITDKQNRVQQGKLIIN